MCIISSGINITMILLVTLARIAPLTHRNLNPIPKPRVIEFTISTVLKFQCLLLYQERLLYFLPLIFLPFLFPENPIVGSSMGLNYIPQTYWYWLLVLLNHLCLEFGLKLIALRFLGSLVFVEYPMDSSWFYGFSLISFR